MKRLISFVFAVLCLAAVVVACSNLPANEPQVRTQLVTVEIIITATPDPNRTPDVIIITATNDPSRPQVDVPSDLVPTGSGSTSDDIESADSTPLAAEAQADVDIFANLPEECVRYIVESGDTPFGIALDFEIDGFLLLSVNGLTEETATQLQVGDELIIPLEGCPIDEVPQPPTETPLPSETPLVSDTPTPTDGPTSTPTTAASATLDVTPTPTVSPTITLPPTATNAQIEIEEVISAGDVTAEGVRIRNTGSSIRITGWILRDADGNEHTFRDQIMFSNSALTLFTRASEDTAIAHFWGLEEPVWQAGDVVTLLDNQGRVQAVYRVPIDTPQG